MDTASRPGFRPFSSNGPQNHGYQHYGNGHQRMPRPNNNPMLTSDLYYFCIGRLVSYVDRYMTRYHDLHLDHGRQEDVKALSKEAVYELALRMNVNVHQAGVMILCDNYARCNLPQGAAAKTKLHDWAEYLYIHLSPTIFPSPEQQLYEQNMMQRAEETGFELWQAYKSFSRNPLDWGNKYAQAEALRVYEELEKAGEAAHRLWLLENQPDRVPPQAAVRKLSPKAKEFLFVKEGSKPSLTESASSRVSSVDDSSVGSTDIDKTPSLTLSLSSRSSAADSDNARQVPSTATPDKASGALQTVSVSAAKSEASTKSDETPSRPPEIETLLDSHSEATAPTSLLPASQPARRGLESVQSSQSSNSVTSTTPPVPKSDKIHSRQSSMNTEQCFNRTIIVFSPVRPCLPATALLDTGCEAPNWVSYEIVKTLGMEKEIFQLQKSKSAPKLLDANGQQFKGIGIIKLSWQHHDPHFKYKYKTWEDDEFYVSPSSHIQVIFGAPWLRKHKLIQVNEDAILPLTPDQKMDLPEIKQQMEENIRARDAKRREAEAERIRHKEARKNKPSNVKKPAKGRK